jgi:hypothetical protein
MIRPIFIFQEINTDNKYQYLLDFLAVKLLALTYSHSSLSEGHDRGLMLARRVPGNHISRFND